MTTGLSDNEQAVSRAYPHQVVAHEVTAESSDCLDDTCTSGNSQTSRLFCNGGVEVVENLLPTETSDQLFEKVLQEVQWETMMHRGGEVPRQVAVQGLTYSDGRVPIYRHPSDTSPALRPFTENVLLIKQAVERSLGNKIELNHCLFNYYRQSTDNISEHSDKTLDISTDPNSFIVNFSLGATRTMIFRLKKKEAGRPRKTERAVLPHNSLCKVSLEANSYWLHSIKPDKRPDFEKSVDELSYGSQRISLTFRTIGTYLNPAMTHIWGQGATSKTIETASPVINGPSAEGEAMVQAFSQENQTSGLDWQATYGAGFDVLHMTVDD